MRHIIFATAAAALIAPAVGAQSSITKDFANLYFELCLGNVGEINPESADGLVCSCAAGVIVGESTERDLSALTEILPAQGDRTELEQVITGLMTDGGFSQEELLTSMAALDRAQSKFGEACF